MNNDDKHSFVLMARKCYIGTEKFFYNYVLTKYPKYIYIKKTIKDRRKGYTKKTHLTCNSTF